MLQVLLRSNLIKSSSEERSLLKNLGSWLGKFTIGRNQALRAKEIDPKSIIVEVLLLCIKLIGSWRLGVPKAPLGCLDPLFSIALYYLI